MTITLRNDFHNTTAHVQAPALPHRLTPSQERRVRKALCGSRECMCGDIRGPQSGPAGQRIDVGYDYEGPFDEHGNLALIIRAR